MKRLLLFLMLFSYAASFGQKDSVSPVFTAGVEADVLPFITGGYYMSVWGGYKHVRYRVVLTKFNMPPFMIPDNFSHNEIDAYAFLIDYFFCRGFRGWWVGTGFEQWNGQIEKQEERATGKYSNYLYTVGGGYVWHVYRGLYLNPWAGIHLRIGGDQTVHVGNTNYTTPFFTPELSLKLGWQF
jgi:hypothetical protein